jgi:hypothetical protein
MEGIPTIQHGSPAVTSSEATPTSDGWAHPMEPPTQTAPAAPPSSAEEPSGGSPPISSADLDGPSITFRTSAGHRVVLSSDDLLLILLIVGIAVDLSGWFE